MIIYLVKSTLLLGLLFGIYKLLLENEKMHRFNRFFLLFALVFGITAPLISFEISPETSVAGVKMQQMERVVNAPAEAVSRSVEPLIVPKQAQEALPKADITPVVAEEPGWSISTLDVLLGIYGSVTLFLLIRFVVGLIEIRNKVKAGSHQETGHATLVLLDEPITPQSFFGYIFLEKEQFNSGNIEAEILEHELVHVRQLHSLDVLFVEFLKVIFWFNPLIYLFKHAIQLNHEFLADESVVSNGSSVSDYQKMLIRLCGGNKPMNTTSSISFSLTKKRFKMMSRKFSTLRSGSRTFLTLPILGLLVLTFCTQKTDNSNVDTEKIYHVPELHYDGNRSKELGVPLMLGAQFTSSGELFTGTQKVYYTKNDSLWMELFFKDGINTGSVIYSDGDTTRQVHGIYEDKLELAQKMYFNGMLVYEDIRPRENDDGIGHVSMWHRSNGGQAFEAFYTGDNVYQGLMTEYDEQGNIIMQERYEDGELISSGGDEMINTKQNLSAPSDTLSNEEQTKIDEAAKIYQEKYQAYMDLNPETTSLEDLRTAFKNVDEAIDQLNQVMREVYGEDVVLPPIKLGPKPEERKKNN